MKFYSITKVEISTDETSLSTNVFHTREECKAFMEREIENFCSICEVDPEDVSCIDNGDEVIYESVLGYETKFYITHHDLQEPCDTKPATLIEKARKSYDEYYKARDKAKQVLWDIVKERGSIEFDYEAGDAPSIASSIFQDDLTDAYIKRLWWNRGIVKADLYAYYLGMDDTTDLECELEADYADILSFVMRVIE